MDDVEVKEILQNLVEEKKERDKESKQNKDKINAKIEAKKLLKK